MDSAAAVLLPAEASKAIDPLRRFDTYFRIFSADTPELIETSFALRYQVYCLERQFEDPAKHADLQEKDEFDRHSVHSLIFYRLRDEAIGTVRVILADPEFEKLPIQKLLRQTGLNPSDRS